MRTRPGSAVASADAERLHVHYEQLPNNRVAEGIDPNVPWLHGHNSTSAEPTAGNRSSNKHAPENRWQSWWHTSYIRFAVATRGVFWQCPVAVGPTVGLAGLA